MASDEPGAVQGAYEVGVEQEPGSGGKESAESTIGNLRGFKVYADKVTGCPEKVGGLAQVTPAWGDRAKAPDYVAQS